MAKELNKISQKSNCTSFPVHPSSTYHLDQLKLQITRIELLQLLLGVRLARLQGCHGEIYRLLQVHREESSFKQVGQDGE
jgi:hypothetical protein